MNELLEQLVGTFVPSATGPAGRSQLVSLCHTLLTSRLSAAPIPDLFHTSEAVQRSLARAGRQSHAVAFADLVRRLESMAVVTRKWSVVHVLAALAETGDVPLPAKPLPRLLMPTSAGAASSTLPSAAVGLSAAAAKEVEMVRRGAGEGAVRAGSGNDGGVSENELLRDVIYALQGIDGRVVAFDKRAQAFAVDPRARVKAGQANLVRRVAELGWLYMRVKAFVVQASAAPSLGLVGQALVGALQGELAEYFKLLAVLEAQVAAGPGAHGQALTLRRLVVWVQDPLVRMKAVAMVADAARGLQGGELVSTIHAFAKHGDPFVAAFVESLLEQVCVPFFAMTSRWMFDGELADPFGEFFVVPNGAASADEAWHGKYELVDGLVPSFVGPDLASDILRIGKSVAFLRRACGVTDFAFDGALVGAWEAVTYASASSQLAGLVAAASDAVNAAVRSTLLGQFKLMPVLDICRRYLLLGQGDFVGYLMELLDDELARPASQVFRHNLLGILETALKSTTPIADAELADKLDVMLLEASPGDIGWDVFSLDYVFTGPLTTIFTNDVRAKYLQLFSFLWRLKRVERHLSSTWQRHVNSASALRQLPELDLVVRKCHILRNEMAHFVFNLQYYIMFEIEGAWTELVELLTSDRTHLDLDAIYGAHEAYIDRILERVLLDGSAEELLSLITQIFALISKFRTTQDVFYDSAMGEVARRAAAEARAYERVLAGEWGTTDKESDASASSYYQLTPQARAQLGAFNVKYDELVTQLIDMLNAQSASALRNLSFRIDFNEFWKSKRSSNP
ncbi:gamma tubulin ring complex protein 3 [Thecamonas trahens ATCC 50062]|uniref:Gamma tubulin ring complex protein 3 n=1 Tax=Thecamonas trahens ATCC 50062 TaxID=461836 RepID=A0A0L0DQR7_THETB|nr:gamma tubulin ring complex protein 3 [Thecamonas trahens ATCC 50062]KNC54620.1 gamma tubulin ring complex protein 3 [Thecamonas trahens ATCC 50062]|eukprot:XP_013761527.1 gamma tubulin ring complex protein 3 [Thecamonas trahens ATCC 50062]